MMNEEEKLKLEYIQCDEPIEIVNWLQSLLDDDYFIFINSLHVIPTNGQLFAFVAIMEPTGAPEKQMEINIDQDALVKTFIKNLDLIEIE